MPSSSDIITPIRLLRSSTASKRPVPGNLLAGQPAVNINSNDPGLYFANSTLSNLLKIGPCHVGPSAPNSSPASGGHPGNCLGESWLDTSSPSTPILRVWDGSNWRASGHGLTGFIWVDVNGDDSNPGTSPQDPKLTIKSALSSAPPGTVILVSPGSYEEDNPLVFSDENITLMGVGGPESTHILPQNLDEDLFYVVDKCIIGGFSFEGAFTTLLPKSTVSFPPLGAGAISEPPLIKNCHNNLGNSIGITSDGLLANGNPSIRTDKFISRNLGGTGFKVLNKGFLEVANSETYKCKYSGLALSGGQATFINSRSFYGEYGLYADGVSPVEQSGEVVSIDPSLSVIEVGNLAEELRPYEGQVLIVGELYYEVSSFNILDGGDGFTSAPTIAISLGSGPNPIAAEGEATINGGVLAGIEVTFPGQGYTASDVITVTITGGSPSCSASAEVVLSPVYHRVLNSVENPSGSYTVEIAEPLTYIPTLGGVVEFYRMSKIVGSSHYMGSVGSNNLTPFNGGVPIPKNKAVGVNGGRVYYYGIDQSGNFSVGEQFTIDQISGSISGNTFTNSVVSTILPYLSVL